MSSDIYIEKQMCIQVYQQLLSIKKSFFPFMFPDDLRAFKYKTLQTKINFNLHKKKLYRIAPQNR